MKWLLLSLVFWVGASQAQPGLASSKALSLLRSIQGQWQIPCSGFEQGGGFRRVKLGLSFTHFKFDVLRYSDDACLQETSSATVVYRFVLGNEIVLADGSRVFAARFIPEKGASDVYRLASESGIRYRDGRLFLSRLPAGTAEDAANHLDYDAAFSR